MDEVRHTPGPWVIDANDRYHVESPDGSALPWSIATISGSAGPGTNRSEANARLIAAAPDLLAALEKLLSYNEAIMADRINYRPEDHASVARAAIAKATGAA